MYYIGLMSGTSMDAVDTALVKFSGKSLEVSSYQQYPIPAELQENLRTLKATDSIALVSEFDVILGELYASAILSLLEHAGISASEIEAIGCHGQTILHLPTETYPRTLQIGDANIIAAKTGITTVADFRRMDIAVGGEGAPLAPAFHAWYLSSQEGQRCILNIGGMANITDLDGDSVYGFDSGPGNALLDDWIRHNQGLDFDRDGQWSMSGVVNQDLLSTMLSYDYFKKQPPKSTGKDEFNLDWLKQMRELSKQDPEAVDIQATLLQLSVNSIADVIKEHASASKEVLVCGGGFHNKALINELQKALPGQTLYGTDHYGIDPDAVEAVAFAWLARQRLNGETGNIPAVTGAKQPVILGAVYPPVTSS